MLKLKAEKYKKKHRKSIIYNEGNAKLLYQILNESNMFQNMFAKLSNKETKW